MYDDDSAAKIDAFLQILTSLSYDNIEEAYKSMKNFTSTDIENINRRSIRSMVSEVRKTTQ